MFKVDDSMKHGCTDILTANMYLPDRVPSLQVGCDAQWNSEGTGGFQRTIASEAKAWRGRVKSLSQHRCSQRGGEQVWDDNSTQRLQVKLLQEATDQGTVEYRDCVMVRWHCLHLLGIVTRASQSSLFYIWSCRTACGILISKPGMEPVPPVVHAQSLRPPGRAPQSRLANIWTPLDMVYRENRKVREKVVPTLRRFQQSAARVLGKKK